MPFTPSHAVVALPFVRTRLVPAAIAVGAMTPDLPLFLRGLVPGYGLTHDFAWMPLTVVMALVLLLVWRCVLRPAVRELSPRAVAARLPERWDAGAAFGVRETLGGGTTNLIWLIVSLALGVASHIVWDLFTHEGRAGAEIFPELDAQWGPLSGVKWLQHGSSVMGLAVLAVAALVWMRGRAPLSLVRVLPAAVRLTWWVSLPVALAGAATTGLVLWGPFDADFTPTHLVYALLPQTAAVWGMLTVALAIVIQVRRRDPRVSGHHEVRHARDVA